LFLSTDRENHSEQLLAHTVKNGQSGSSKFSNHCLKGKERENSQMKKKMLVLGSFGAMLLSAALLFTPPSAKAFPHRCTTCSKHVNGGTQVAVCEPLTADSCSCPLPPPLVSNSCF
jgi:hypothetical protein